MSLGSSETAEEERAQKGFIGLGGGSRANLWVGCDSVGKALGNARVWVH